MATPARKFRVIVDERVEHDLDDIPKHIVLKFLRALDELENNPYRPRPTMDIKKLVGLDDAYRLRLGKYRVLYAVNFKELTVRVTSIKSRDKAYD